MKGITNAPLVIWVYGLWYSRPELLALMRAGHAVVNMGADNLDTDVRGEPDLILHPAAGWTEDLFDYLPAALTRARARKRSK